VLVVGLLSPQPKGGFVVAGQWRFVDPCMFSEEGAILVSGRGTARRPSSYWLDHVKVGISSAQFKDVGAPWAWSGVVGLSKRNS
jgi:hypothetical protein